MYTKLGKEVVRHKVLHGYGGNPQLYLVLSVV